MPNTMLHIFRNSPIGRENLLQSVYFCRTYSGLVLEIFIPQRTHFTMDLGDELFAVQLDGSYTRYPESAEARVNEIMKGSGCEFRLIGPDTAAGVSPSHLPGTWSIISCPRVLTEDLSRIGLGHIGPKVRGLVKAAPFPVFVPSLANKAWRSVTAFFGGSELGARAVKAALAIARQAQMPAYVHTQLDGTTKADCEESLEKVGALGSLSEKDVTWRMYEAGDIVENLYDVPHDSLVVIGACGHRLIKELVFGSKLEVIQSSLPNPLMVIGPVCRTLWT